MKKTFELPKKFTDKWLEALRSGEYEQAKGQLYLDGNYCCLGVACRLIGVEDEIMSDHGTPHEMEEEKVDFKDMPSVLIDNAGTHELQSILMMLNDGVVVQNYIDMVKANPDMKIKPWSEEDAVVRYSFKEIATFIEENCELV